MKKIALPIILIIIIFPFQAMAEKVSGSLEFKQQMHGIFDSYNNARISINLEKLDIADIYLDDMLEAIKEAKKHAPEKDNRRILDTFGKLEGVVKELKAAIKRGDRLTTKIYSMDMFKGCVACHTESKLDVLFKQTRRTSLFGEYMHKVSENLDMARMLAEEKGTEKEAARHLKLVIYYLDLLTSVFPEEGPSGVVMDRQAFSERIAGVREGVESKTQGEKTPDLEGARKTLNGLCVACHEPERIK